MEFKKFVTSIIILIVAIFTCFTIPTLLADSPVRIWEEPLVIPTYEVDKPDPNPRFYTGRAYQGAQGRAYPYPMFDRLTDVRKDKTYNAVYLENEYIKICVLPEIGGRVFSALDKTNNFDFLYRQHVIKPALIGMLGAWISGGIEWNFPHHHRASVFLPMDYMLQENPDGSKTIWMSEIEMRHRMRWVIGITLYPGKSYFEVTIKIFNRTPLVHSFLYWANVSVHTNPEYQIIFPPSTEFATYHSKNAYAHWPISHEIYRGVDYTKGVDISWWKNHPSPMSFFAWNYEDDFLAGYDHQKEAGTVYVANHHIAPGKKFWQWGPGPRGSLWDKILTDFDGPYVELMVGGYSDNQPDYSWLQPYEGKIIKQYWYPIRGIDGVKNSNLEAAVNLEVTPKKIAKIGFNTTSAYEKTTLLLKAGDKVIFKQVIDISPDRPFQKEIALPSAVKEEDLRVSLLSFTNEELIAYKPVKKKGEPMPEVVKPPLSPKDIKTVEELYLTGLRLEQFYNPALEPYPYYEEALKREPGNYRVNVALGILYYKGGLFKKAEEKFRTALKRATKDYTSPRDGESLYYLALVLKLQGKYDEAYNKFYKATWSYPFSAAAYHNLTEIDCIRGDFLTALKHIDRSIVTNAWNTKALNLKTAILRRLGRFEQAVKLSEKILNDDPLNFWVEHELYLSKSAMGLEKEATEVKNSLLAKREIKVQPWYEAQTYLEIAVDYGNCGLWDEAIKVLSLLTDSDKNKATTYPMVYYYLGYLWDKKGDTNKAAQYYQLGNKMPPDYCFPFRSESINMLRTAFNKNPKDARAPYYLGNLFYDSQPKNAIIEWEKSRALDDKLATVHRNLGVAYAQVENDVQKAIVSLEKAVVCDNTDPRLFYELDVLYEAGGVSPEKRLALLQKNHQAIVGHNDAFSREIVLLTQLGYYDQSIDFMNTHHFRRWEGLGNIHTSYVDAHILRGQKFFKDRQFKESIADYEAALEYPENLEVAKPYHGGRACEVYCLMGATYEALGNAEKAKEFYEKSTTTDKQKGWSALSYYQGLAFQKLDKKDKARQIFDGLINFGNDKLETLKAGASLEFFAKFGKKRSKNEEMADAFYLIGLGYLGKGNQSRAKLNFEKSVKLNVNHLWAKVQLSETGVPK
jgi:tetratricopeptide (TPR) repeat protein